MDHLQRTLLPAEQRTAAWAEIRTADLQYNLRTIRGAVGADVRVCGILKADAYGHGMVGMRRCLAEQGLVDMISVGRLTELIRLAEESQDDGLSVLLLGSADSAEIEQCLSNPRIHPERTFFSLYSLEQFEALAQLAERVSVMLRVHLRVDGWNSGMGLGYDEYLERQDWFFSQKYVDVCGIYSHLYTSYSDDREEIRFELERFDRLLRQIRPEHRKRMTVHILNSALVFDFPEFAYDMVRVGTAMYGLPCGARQELRPIMRICARIFDVREIALSVPLSYQPVDCSGGKRKIARIMLGYWDAPLLLTQKDVHIRIKDRLFSLADDICMDNLCIDITGTEDIRVGDLAVVLGEEGVSVGDVTGRNGIHFVHSERMCMTAGRLEKRYI